MKVGIQQISHTHKSIAAHAQNIDKLKGDRTFVVTNTMKSAVRAYLDFRTYKIGSMYVDQKTSLPIG
eukprot:4642803-Karenia_brevis.AAC.1